MLRKLQLFKEHPVHIMAIMLTSMQNKVIKAQSLTLPDNAHACVRASYLFIFDKPFLIPVVAH